MLYAFVEYKIIVDVVNTGNETLRILVFLLEKMAEWKISHLHNQQIYYNNTIANRFPYRKFLSSLFYTTYYMFE